MPELEAQDKEIVKSHDKIIVTIGANYFACQRRDAQLVAAALSKLVPVKQEYDDEYYFKYLEKEDKYLDPAMTIELTQPNFEEEKVFPFGPLTIKSPNEGADITDQEFGDNLTQQEN